MAVTDQNPAPYATSSGLLDIINRYRNRGMQTPINAEVLGRAGVSDSLISRTLQALVSLELITEDGIPTETFEGLRVAPETEYKQRLEEWLRSVYADVFGYVDPLQDDEVKIRDAFRTYRPMGQQQRMVSLFIGLCDAAGLRPEVSVQRKPKATVSRKKATSSSNSRTPKTRKKSNKSTDGGLPSALEGLLQSLPNEGEGWTKDQQDTFIKTFEAVLAFCYPIVAQVQDESKVEESDEGEK